MHMRMQVRLWINPDPADHEAETEGMLLHYDIGMYLLMIP